MLRFNEPQMQHLTRRSPLAALEFNVLANTTTLLMDFQCTKCVGFLIQRLMMEVIHHIVKQVK